VQNIFHSPSKIKINLNQYTFAIAFQMYSEMVLPLIELINIPDHAALCSESKLLRESDMQNRHFHLNSSQREMQYFMNLVNVLAPVWAREPGGS
jgi:hypothetical protein